MSQQDKSTLQSAINTQLADNTSGDISAADVRDNLINMTDSLVFNEGTGQTITGGLTVTGGITGSLEGTSTTASYVETAQTASYVLNAVSASYAISASYEINYETSSSYADFAETASYVETAQTASYVENAQTASYFDGIVTSASYATYASTASKVASIPITANWVRVGLLPLAGENQNQPLGYDGDNNFRFNAGTNELFSPNISSSVSITGSSILAINGFTGSLLGTATTASYVENAQTASYFDGTVTSASYASTASYVENAQTASYFDGIVTSASYASTASYVNPLIQSTTITGSLTVTQIDPLLYFAANHTTRLFKNFTSADCAFSLSSGGNFNPGIYKWSNSIVLPWDKKIQSYSIYNNILSSSALSTVISLPPIYNAGYSVGETISVYNLSATSPSIKDSGSFYIVASMQGVTSVFSNTINGTFSTAYILSGSWGNYTNITLTDQSTTASIQVNPGQKAIFEVAYWGTNSPAPSSSIAGFSFNGYYTNDSYATTTTNCYYLFRGIENL